MTLVVFSSRMPATAEALFEFHMDTANLERISPPFPPFRVLSPSKPAEPGDLQRFRIGAGPLARTWEARVTAVLPGRLLEDTQESGPFLRWRHQHRFRARGEAESVLTDVVAFRLLPTPAGEFLEYLFVRPAMIAMFAWRHRKTRQLLAHHKS